MPNITIDEIGTNEVVVRPMNEEEIKALKIVAVEAQNEKTAADELKAKKASLLERLGITEEEAKLLLGGN